MRFPSNRKTPILALKIDYTGTQRHYPVLDGLRGVAVLLVIFYHVFGLDVGWMGVDLFFVLSGFLITSILLDSKENLNYFSSFYIKRFLRIFPLYFGVLILYFVPYILAGSSAKAVDSVPYFLYVQNIVFSIQNAWPQNYLFPLNHFWSLAIEEQFYCLFPLVIYFVPKRYLLPTFLLSIIATLICRYYFWVVDNPVASYAFSLCRSDGLVIGAITALYVRKFKQIHYWLILPAVLLFISQMAVSVRFDHQWYRLVGYTVNAIFFGIVLLVSLTNLPFTRLVFEHPVLRHFGKYAYGLYVFHHIYFSQLEYFVQRMNFPYGTEIVIILTLMLTYVTARISFAYFEKPILAYKEKLAAPVPSSI